VDLYRGMGHGFTMRPHFSGNADEDEVSWACCRPSKRHVSALSLACLEQSCVSSSNKHGAYYRKPMVKGTCTRCIRQQNTDWHVLHAACQHSAVVLPQALKAASEKALQSMAAWFDEHLTA
jgi:hypothetical protein